MNTAAITPNIAAGFGTRNYRAYALSALMVIYVFEVIDRIFLSLVQEKVRAELGLSDFQLGLLSGPGFVLLYVLCTIPIAHLAERHNRIAIIATGAAVWSAATAACGLATTFAQLFLARMFVGIGEAACLPPSHSTISDYFPPAKRGSALALFSLAIPIGIVAAAFGGGWLVQRFSWRWAFFLLGGLGIAAAVLLKLSVKDPPRSGSKDDAPHFIEGLRSLAAKPTYRHAVAGGALASIFGFSITNFFVSYTVREYGLDIGTASFGFGVLFGFAVAIGIFLGGFLCDHLQARIPQIAGWLPAASLLVAVPLYFAAFRQASYNAAFALFFVALIFHYMFNAPMFTIGQQVAGPRNRATASAVMMLSLTLVGFGIGPPLVGAIADHFNAQFAISNGVTLALCKASPQIAACAKVSGYGLKTGLSIELVFFVWAGFHFWMAGHTYIKDRHE